MKRVLKITFLALFVIVIFAAIRIETPDVSEIRHVEMLEARLAETTRALENCEYQFGQLEAVLNQRDRNNANAALDALIEANQ